MGIPREELKSRSQKSLRNSTKLFNTSLSRLVNNGELVEAGPFVHKPDHTIHFNSDQQKKVDHKYADIIRNEIGDEHPVLKKG